MKNLFQSKQIILVIIKLVICHMSYAQEPVWANSIAGSNFEHGVDSDLDSNGNLFVVGWSTSSSITSDSITASNGLNTAFIAKYAPNRDVIWIKTIGADDAGRRDRAFDIHVDKNNDIIVLVQFNGTIFKYDGAVIPGVSLNNPNGSGQAVMLKLDNDGNYLWHDKGGPGASWFKEVDTDSINNIYLTGSFYNTLLLGGNLQLTSTFLSSGTNAFVAKYNSSGLIQWGKAITIQYNNDFANGHSIALNNSFDTLVVSGIYQGSISFDTGTLSTSQLISTFLVAYNTTGVELWKTAIFDTGYAYCEGLDISSNGLIGISGYNSLASSPKGLLGFYDLNGNKHSEHVFPSPYCRLYGLEFNNENECFITGEFRDSVTFEYPLDTLILHASFFGSGFILKLNSLLWPTWLKQIPAAADNSITCKDSMVFYSGSFYGDTFVYNFWQDTLIAVLGDAVYAEISDTSCQINFGIDSLIACNTLTWINGKTYQTSMDSVYHVLPKAGANGCDSIVELNLTIKKISDTSVSLNNLTISSNNVFANYQWLRCDSGYMTLPGETNQTLTVNQNGSYAVELTENGCIDTSICITISNISLPEHKARNFSIYPNPSSGKILIELNKEAPELCISLYDMHGKLVYKSEAFNKKRLKISFDGPLGIYMLRVQTPTTSETISLVKE